MNEQSYFDNAPHFVGEPVRHVEHLRLPPQSVEAEQAVLGGLMLVHPEKLDDTLAQVRDLLETRCFYRRDHQLIWRAILHLVEKKRPVDAVTLGEWFESQGLAEHVAGGAYLVELASGTPSAANIRAYAEIIADKAKLRALIEIGTGIVNNGYQPDGRNTLDLIGSAQTSLSTLLANEPCELEEMAPVLQSVFDDLTERTNAGGGITGLATGYTDYDALINGLSPGLHILAARPKMGKTTLAQNIAEHFALVHGTPVAVFSLEMQPDALGRRMLSSVGDVDAERIRRGELDDADWANLSTAMRKLRAAPLMISRPRNARVEHIVAQIRRAHSRRPLGLVVIDYLQLIAISGDNRASGLAEVTRTLALLAGELKLPVLLLSQLNRELEKRPDKHPIPSDLRDSGAIEQDADSVTFIYRDEYYHRDSRYKGTAEIIVALQRNGPNGECRLAYRPDRNRFENLPFDWEPAAPAEKPAKSRGMRRAKGGNLAAEAAAGDS